MTNLVETDMVGKRTKPRPKPAPRGPWLTTGEAAAYIGTSERTMAVWRSKGTGPAFVMGSSKVVRYSYVDLDKWMGKPITPRPASERRGAR